MQKIQYPRFIQSKPIGDDLYDGKSAIRVAEAIKKHIESIEKSNLNQKFEGTQIPQIIGLEGEWGSGKSNVIKLLQQKLSNSYYVFEYDAWGHQEDLQRRSFLESLTTELVNKELLTGKTSISIKGKTKKDLSWKEKLKYLLAKKSETETESFPKIGYGIISAMITTILSPILYYLTTISVWFCILPLMSLIIPLILWLIKVCEDKEKYGNIDFLFAVYKDKVTEGVKYETISTDEPSVTEFRQWMQDVSDSLKDKKLIIVFDNMDRLPSQKVKELWSSIHTFFAESHYPKIWTIIPFDRAHLANAYGEGDIAAKIDLTNHFINKTFPVIYRVPLPIMTDWNKVFLHFYGEAFGNTEDNDKDMIQRVYSIIENNITPRNIITFINNIVALKLTWNDEIPILFLAIFTLQKEIILKDPVNEILEGNNDKKYLSPINSIIKNTEELQNYISALVYGVKVENAAQIPLKRYLESAIYSNTKFDINSHSMNSHFVPILGAIISTVYAGDIDQISKVLSCLKPPKIFEIESQWDLLVDKYTQFFRIENIIFNDSQKALLKYSSNQSKIKLVKYLCHSFAKTEIFLGSKYFIALQSLESFMIEKELNIPILDYIDSNFVSATIFKDFVNEAKSDYLKYKLKCDNNELNNYLTSSLISNYQTKELINYKASNMDFIQYLVKDENFSFDIIKSEIEKAITDNIIDFKSFYEIIKVYKFISNEKPLKKQLDQNTILSIYNVLRSKTSEEAYFEIVAMGLSTRLFDIQYDNGIENHIAERIEYYKTLGELLLLVIEWPNSTLKISLKTLINKPVGKSQLEIEKILPRYELIKNTLEVNDQTFLTKLNEFHQDINIKIDTDNIERIIQSYEFYEHSVDNSLELTNQINKIAKNKLTNIDCNILFLERNNKDNYWLNCAAILIKGDVITTLPDNLIEFCRLCLDEISKDEQLIPLENSIISIILNRADKLKLQSKIKTIWDNYCNLNPPITPKLFSYFASQFNSLNTLVREKDISRNILANIIDDATCRELIFEQSEDYIRIINNSGDDAEDLKNKLKEIIKNNNSELLFNFSQKIGINLDDKINNQPNQ